VKTWEALWKRKNAQIYKVFQDLPLSGNRSIISRSRNLEKILTEKKCRSIFLGSRSSREKNWDIGINQKSRLIVLFSTMTTEFLMRAGMWQSSFRT
jgi:hypothetical protein